MRVLIREPKGKGVELVVRDVPVAALSKRGGSWQVSDSIDSEELARLPVGGPQSNIDARAAKFAERHKAIDLLDDAAITRAVGSAPKRRKATTGPSGAVNQAAILGDSDPWNRRDEDDDDPADNEGDSDEEQDDDEDDAELDRLLADPDPDPDPEDPGDEENDEGDEEAELDEALLDLGWPPEEIDEMPHDAKLSRVSAGETPPKKKGGPPAKAKRKAKEDAARREAMREREQKEAEGKQAAQSEPAGQVRPVHRRIVNDETGRSTGEPVRTKRRRNIPSTPAPAPIEPDPEPAEEPQEAEQDAGEPDGEPVNHKLPIRGYRLEVYRKTWPTITVDGREVSRRYEVGDTPDLDEVNEIAAKWREVGFVAQIKDLPYHHKAPSAKRTIRFDEPYEPIVCLMPSCTWVGDHFTPHLRVHGVSLESYRRATKYTGPIAVGSATASLDKAHDAIRKKNDIHAGQFVVEVHGTHDVSVWRIEKCHRKQTGSTQREDGSEAPIYEHSFTVSPLGGGDPITLDPVALFARFHPVATWAQRLLREMGVERRRA
jgi:hypothetical protein